MEEWFGSKKRLRTKNLWKDSKNLVSGESRKRTPSDIGVYGLPTKRMEEGQTIFYGGKDSPSSGVLTKSR